MKPTTTPGDDEAPRLRMRSPSSATTISSIAVQSKKTRIVVALLQSGATFDLKIVEMDPSVGEIGQSFYDAADLQASHLDAMRSIQSKQSPVEDLLRQADELIANQKPSAEVYSSMAESLGTAWKNLNRILEERKEILDQNYLFQGHYQDFYERTNELEVLCRKSREVKKDEDWDLERHLRQLGLSKRSVLEASVYALQEGEALLQKLNALWHAEWIDSRTDCLRTPVARAISQVEIMLEGLHDRRLFVDALLKKSVAEMKDSATKTSIRRGLERLDALVRERAKELERYHQDVGACVSSVEVLLLKAMALQQEAATFSDTCLGFVGDSDSTEAAATAYSVLETIAAYQRALEHRTSLLTRSGSFFKDCQNANYQFDDLETNLKSTAHLKADNVDHVLRVVEDTLKDVLGTGELILKDLSGHSQATHGIRQSMDHLRSRSANLKSACQMAQAHINRNHEVLVGFKTKLSELSKWIEVSGFKFLQTSFSLGQSAEKSAKILADHKDLFNKAHLRLFELEGLRSALKTVSEQATTAETQDVEQTMMELSNQLSWIKSTTDVRISLFDRNCKFLRLFHQLENEMMTVEQQLNQHSFTSEQHYSFEESRLLIQQLYLQIRNLGKNVVEDINRLPHDDQIDKTGSISAIEKMISGMNLRQTSAIEAWSKIDKKVKDERRAQQEWSKVAKEPRDLQSTMKSTLIKLFPIVANLKARNLEEILSQLDEKLTEVSNVKFQLDKITACLNNIARFLESIDEKSNDPHHEARELEKNLESSRDNIQAQLPDYEVLLQMIVSFLKNLTCLKTSLNNIIEQYRDSIIPRDLVEAEVMAREHEAGKKSVFEIVKYSKRELTQIIEKINGSRYAIDMDPDKSILTQLLSDLIQHFEEEWETRKMALTRNAKFKIFSTEMDSFLTSVAETCETIEIRTSVEESILSVNSAMKFLENLESSKVESLDLTFNKLKSTGQSLCVEVPEHSGSVQGQLQTGQDKLKQLKTLIEERKSRLEAAKEFFGLVEKAEALLKDSNRSLINWSSKVDSTEAECIKNEIEKYLKVNRPIQCEVLARLSTTAGQIFGRSAFERIQIIQHELNETYDALTSLQLKATETLAKRKNAEEEARRAEKLKSQAEAEIRAAKAEAESARLKAKRRVFEAETQTEESKREVKQVHSPIAPHFVEFLKDVVILEGEAWHLRARVSGTPTPQITWFKNGVPIEGATEYLIQYDSQNGVCRLSGQGSKSEDSGNWSLRVSNEAGYAESHSKLTVQPLPIEEPKAEIPAFEEPLANVRAESGSEVQLRCKVRGIPAPTISWIFNNKNVDEKNGSGIASFYNGREAVLLVDKVTKDFLGKYVCKATNIAGTATSTCVISLVEPTPKPVEVQIEKSKPSFYVPLKNQECLENQEVVLECSTTGYPIPSHRWYKNDVPLASGKDFQIVSTGDNISRLVIFKMKADLEGEFKVKAVNSVGECASSCKLSVKKILAPQEPAKRAKTAPKFTSPVHGVMTEEGVAVKLVGVFQGSPDFRVNWLHNSKVLVSNDEVGIETKNKVTSLVIKKVSAADAGTYTCRIENDAGVSESSADVVVKKKQLSPVFLKRLRGVAIEVGKPLVLEIEVGGSQPMEVIWSKNDEKITFPHHRFNYKQFESFHALIVKDPQESDSGDYSVRATNAGGSAFCEADVQVRPTLPAKHHKSPSPSPPPRPPPPRPIPPAEEEMKSESRMSIETESKMALTLGPESSTLRALANFQYHARPLPELLPFPFKADERQEQRRKNPGKVPKPSKFQKGEMYYSDYESDWGYDSMPGKSKLPVRWKSCQSDTEDGYSTYRKVKAPKLNIRTPNERHPSPPCPHQWESHEEIDKLEQSLKSSVFETSARSIKSEYIQDTIDKSVSRENHSSTSIGKKSFTSSLPRTKSNSNPNLQADPKFCTLDSKVRSSNHRRFENENISQDHFSSSFETSISTRITSKKEEAKIVNLPSNLEKQPDESAGVETFYHGVVSSVENKSKLPAVTLTQANRNLETSNSEKSTLIEVSKLHENRSEEISESSLIVEKSRKFVSVKDKVKLLEQKVEEDFLQRELLLESGSGLRPEEIPGAVRVFPPPSPSTSRPGSRKGSLTLRGSSTEPTFMSPVTSPLTVPRSSQPSPIFTRKTKNFSDVESDPEGPAPPKWKPNLDHGSKMRPNIDLKETVKEIRRELVRQCMQSDQTAATGKDGNPKRNSVAKTIILTEEQNIKQEFLETKSLSKYQTVSSSGLIRNSDANHTATDIQLSSVMKPRSPKRQIITMTNQEASNETTDFRSVTSDYSSWTTSLEESGRKAGVNERTIHSSASITSSNMNLDGETPPPRPPPPGDKFYLDDLASEPKSEIESRFSTFERSGFTTTDINMTDSENEIAISVCRKRFSSKSPRQTPDHQFSKSPKLSPKVSPKMAKKLKKQDGYEADTDDTLQRKNRRSVKELAGLFQTAENACPSPLPFRPRPLPGDSDYESDTKTSDSIIFNNSRAYVPPKWAPGFSEMKTYDSNSSHNTKILRLNQQEMSTSASSTFVSQKHETFTTFNDVVSHHVFDSNPATTFSEGVADIKTTKEVPVFQPKKFVPMSNTTNDGFSQPASALGMKAKWSPFGNQKNEPSYRKIQPNLSSKTSESNQPSLFKKSPQSATCAVGEKVVFEAELSSTGEHEMIWSFESRPMVLDERRLFKSEGNRSTLEISPCNVGDSGMYNCTIVTPSNTETQYFSLIVQPKI